MSKNVDGCPIGAFANFASFATGRELGEGVKADLVMLPFACL